MRRTKDIEPRTRVEIRFDRESAVFCLTSEDSAAIAAVAAGFGSGVTDSVVAVVVDIKFEDVVVVVEVVILVGDKVIRDVKVVDPGGGTGKVRVSVKLSSDEELEIVDTGMHGLVRHPENNVVLSPPPPSSESPVTDIQFSFSYACITVVVETSSFPPVET